ncbi:MAG: NAD(P)/FAD-dependent oxidoreductase [Gemmataceae bacterium]
MTVPATITLDAAAAGRWNAAVVGAGPAGAMTARELARRGRRVLLIDKATFPRPKVCGCCLNRTALGALSVIGLGGLVGRCGAVSLGGVELATGGKRVRLSLPGGVALSRGTFDAALIGEAVRAGADFLPGTAVRLGPATDGGRELLAGPTVIGAGVVIAADGLNGQLTTPPQVADGSRIGAGVIADTAPDAYRPGTIYMAVGRGGYVGAVRLEDGRLDLAAAFDAVAVRAAGGLGESAAVVLRGAGLPAIPDLEALPWKGTPPLTRRPRQVAGERWFAVGDAAGYVEPFTGEGMAWAIASAAGLAPIAAADWSPDRATEWAATYARLVGRRQGVCKAAAAVLRSPALCRVCVNALSLVPALARPVVAALNRPSRLTPEPAA